MLTLLALVTAARALEGREALGQKAVLGVSFHGRWEQLQGCGLDAGALARVAASAAFERQEARALAGGAWACVLDQLDAAWARDRARGAPRWSRDRERVTVAYEVFATQFDANTADEVAIPDHCIKFANLGWETCSAGYANPDYVVEEARAACYDDDNGGLDQYGRTCTYPAGLDLAVEIAGNPGLAYLGNDWVDLTFPWEGYST